MQVAFVYIKSYKNIQAQYFNFGSEYNFKYNKLDHSIEYEKNLKFIPNYYRESNDQKPSNISNITALVGQNGSGKSTFLEYFAQFFRSWGNTHSSFFIEDDIVIASQSNNIWVFHNNKIEECKLETKGKIPLGKVIPQKTNLTHNEIFYQSSQAINNTLRATFLPIYYSNSMHDRLAGFGFTEGDIINVSSSYLFYETNMPLATRDGRTVTYKRLKSPSIFKYEDYYRQLTFLLANDREKYASIDFKFYNYVGISVSQQLTREQSFRSVFMHLFKKFIPNNDIEFIRLQIIASTLCGLVYPPKHLLPDNVRDIDFVNLFKESITNIDTLENAALKYLEISPLANTTTHHTGLGIPLELHNFRLPQKSDFIKYLFKSFNKNNFREIESKALDNFYTFKNFNGELEETNINFNPYTHYLTIESCKLLLELYLNQLEELTPAYLDVDFGLSSGEHSMLNLYSRFYTGYIEKDALLRRTQKHGVHEIYSVITVIIDEVETFFHPQWQKEIISKLIHFFGNLFKGCQVQLIIASHSPFITSDLPSYNVIYLEPNENGLCRVSDSSNHNETLGANIHLLFRDAFYLKNGFMGDHAKSKVQEVIEELKKSNNSETILSAKYIYSILNNLGEPVLKEKLLEMFNSKYPDFDDKTPD